MSDSIDRVFVHALNTVKKIPRMGSARPPPADRLRLYGLYKQSMEGDVDGVMDRPRGDDDEIRSDQEKWDSWYAQKGLSRTEAKREYIAHLINTMNSYASTTPDARELVAELEFVWDQIKFNAPSSSSSQSYPLLHNSNTSPSSSHNRVVYPVMSERVAQDPRRASTPSAMRMISPVSESQRDDMVPEEMEDDREAEVREEFVDAQDSQVAENEHESPEESLATESQAEPPANDIRTAARTITRFISGAGNPAKSAGTSDEKWQRRIEKALVKMNAEMAALREQLEMQQEAAAASSSILPFGTGRRKLGWFQWSLSLMSSVSFTIVRHVFVNAALLAAISLWMHYRGIPLDRLEQGVLNWIRRVQSWALVRRLGRMTNQRNAIKISKSLGFRSSRPSRPVLDGAP